MAGWDPVFSSILLFSFLDGVKHRGRKRPMHLSSSLKHLFQNEFSGISPVQHPRPTVNK
jgi:hypothetical protein